MSVVFIQALWLTRNIILSYRILCKLSIVNLWKKGFRKKYYIIHNNMKWDEYRVFKENITSYTIIWNEMSIVFIQALWWNEMSIVFIQSLCLTVNLWKKGFPQM
jgi:hypothetical protein